MSDEYANAQRISERLAGRNILVTGATGFLAKVFVEKLLRSVETIGGVHLLVRPKADGTAAKTRVWQEVLGSSVYDRLRASLGNGFARLCDEKIHVYSGDLTKDRLGLGHDTYHTLSQSVDLVVNSAATVTFDERIDLAVQLNALGPSRLLQFAHDAGDIPFLHVSTCYVCGVRSGTVAEDFSAPEAALDRLPRIADSGAFDLDGLVDSLLAMAGEVRHRFAADQEMCRRRLIEVGMEQARSYGWNDTYTFTKWIGEQLLVRDHGDVPVAVFRPAIIEGSFDEPTPGWIDGLRMADPIIVAYGRGKLSQFPADHAAPIDLIPVDFVANAMIATLPVGDAKPTGIVVYQCGSSERNPFKVGALARAMTRAFRRRPMTDDNGRPIRQKPMRAVQHDAFVTRWTRRRRRIAWLDGWFRKTGGGGRRLRRLAATLRQVDQVLYFARIYSPYTHFHCRFAVDNLQSVSRRMHAADRKRFPFDVEVIDWSDYIVNRHIPGLRSYVLRTGSEPSGRLRATDDGEPIDRTATFHVLQGANLFEVFMRAALRYADTPALQIRRGGRWLRYTYAEALSSTGTIMLRLQERGLKPSDRVAICAENGPEWGLTYLGIMRAGMTAVPLDPQLPPSEAMAAARFADAALVCAGRTTFDALSRQAAEDAGHPDVVLMSEPFIPRPGASRDQLPDPVAVEPTALASILFTSGTTVSPRAVQLSHANFIANARALVQVHPVDSSDELLSVLPMYHAFEFTAGFLIPLIGGTTITYVEQLKGPDVLAAMQATGTTIMLVVPRLLKMFRDSLESTVAAAGAPTRVAFRVLGLLSTLTGRRLARVLYRSVHRRFGGRLRLFVCGGSRLEPDLFWFFERLGFHVCEGYGLTETSPVLTVNPRRDRRAGSVGTPLSNVELEIRNQSLEGVGEIWAAGPNITSGYLKNREATEAVLDRGWFRTGDLGRLDDGGYLFITGRSKDLIVTSAGKNVYPDEVEALYSGMPYAKELCVFGAPARDGLGDEVHAVVVVNQDLPPELDRSSVEREIRAAAEAIGKTTPPHQRISALHFWREELPKTSTLKAKRSLIRDMICSQESPGRQEESATTVADETPVNEEALQAVRGILARHSSVAGDRIQPGMHLHLDLAIDSIGKMEVLGSVEVCFDFRIDNEAGAQVARVADLLSLIGNRRPSGPVSGASNHWQRRLAGATNGTPPDDGTPMHLLPARWVLRGTVAAFMHTYVRVNVRHHENIPGTGGFILAPNHASHLDTPAVITAVGGRRRLWTAGADDYFFNTRLKRIIFGQLLDTIAFDRHVDGVAGLGRCRFALRRGDGLLLFPEGSRSVSGEMQTFKIGVAVLAVDRKVPIVPVHIHRAWDLMPKGSRFAKPGLITVTFGEPIEPPKRSGLSDPYATFQELTRCLQESVDRLAHEVGD